MSSDDSENEELKREFDAFEKAERQAPLSKWHKHDLTHSGRMNACKLTKMNIPTGKQVSSQVNCFQGGFNHRFNFPHLFHLSRSGDVGNPTYDMKLNNNVFNSLKTHAKKERKRFARLNEKAEKSTAEGVMDERSKLVLFKLINAEIIDEVNGIISTGKFCVEHCFRH